MINFPQEVAIYGNGSFGRSLASILIENNIQVKYIIDQNTKFENTSFNFENKKIKVILLEQANNEDPVIIGVHNTKTDVHEILENLNLLGFFNIISPVQLVHVFRQNQIRFENYWLSVDFDLSEHEYYIKKLSEGLEDEISRQLLTEIIEYRINGQLKKSPKPLPEEQQYFPEDITEFINNDLRILDCGGFPGELPSWAHNSGNRIDEIIMLEPDRNNHKALNKFLLGENINNAVVLPFAVYSRTTQISFQEEMGTSSKIENGIEGSQSTVTAVALDDLFLSFSPNLIKMDIEGAELDSLIGCRKILQKYKPNLAISIYHKPDDLYKIFEYLHNLNLDYRFSIRTYGHQTFDTILYAY